MTNSILRKILNLIVAVSLAVSPVTVVLGAVDAGRDMVAHSEKAESCHHHSRRAQDEADMHSADLHGAATTTDACTCCDDDCTCADYGACVHSHTATLLALLLGSPPSYLGADDAFVTAGQDGCTGVSLPPSVPPPIA